MNKFPNRRSVTAKHFFRNFLNLDGAFNTHEKWDKNNPKTYKYEITTMIWNP